ncbi:hypothetical protein G1C98_1034 [Bifidobacterium sp. DSM 109960]|uniref:Terminase small subunit n=1 Tax=Bifidobacterium erythrocebi TaxID=2675325 RepID=A0A7Y0EUM8_9BIFI|nr:MULTISPECIES: hypothetical protein [Bifidobacterium]MBW3095354.1 hypothetical protein [Bifidobacterium pongonis]NMM96298.1 hypothetical protein [Bifidobacterium sp. DSM 109960]
MPIRTCAQCGHAIPKNASAKRKYCSDNCRKLASKHRRSPQTETSLIPSLHDEPSPQPTDAPATYRDMLEVSRAALMRNLKDSHCPATAVAGLSKQLLAVGKELLEMDREREPDPILDDPEEMADGSGDDPFDAEAI